MILRFLRALDRFREWVRPRTIFVEYFRAERDGDFIRGEVRWKRKYGEYQTDRWTKPWSEFDGTIWQWRQFSIVVAKELMFPGAKMVDDLRPFPYMGYDPS